MSSDPQSLRVHVVRVFCDDHDDHGNALGIVMDGPSVPSTAARQEIAYELGFSETVFVDHAKTGSVRIFTPSTELKLAGHPLVGTAWLLAHLGGPVEALHPPAGAVLCGASHDAAWIEADPAWSPPWTLQQLASPADVDAIDADTRAADGFDYVWAWIDEAAGIVRSRAFVKEHGIVEDEATGSAALMLGAKTGRRIEIRQGRGSTITAQPTGRGTVRVSGRVVSDGADLAISPRLRAIRGCLRGRKQLVHSAPDSRVSLAAGIGVTSNYHDKKELTFRPETMDFRQSLANGSTWR